MDRTITFPEDELTEEEPWYMELSDDEETDSNSAPAKGDCPLSASLAVMESRGTEREGLNGGNLTASRDSGNFTEASLETSISCGSSVADTCSSCGGVLQRGGGKEPLEGGRGLCSTAGGRNGGCRLSPGGTHRCERCRNGGVHNGAGGLSLDDCGCGWRKRRQSTNGILDKEGQALLEILEFPSKVSTLRLSL